MANQAEFIRLYLGECNADPWEAARRAGYALPDLSAANAAYDRDPRKTESAQRPGFQGCDRCNGIGTVASRSGRDACDRCGGRGKVPGYR